ncbi:integrase, catalytic region, zinc finger, CCHC-type containing protein [Tanacetum coccineum]
MTRQCTKSKRPRNFAWFKEKAMLVEALELEIVLDEEQIAFLADNGDAVTTVQQSQEIPTLATFQTNDLDAFDSNYDEAPFVRAILMANLSSYDFVTLSKAFWLPIFKPISELPLIQPEPLLKEIPREFPTISLFKDSFNKIRSHVNHFENVVTIRTKVTSQNEGSCGFEHIRKAFDKDVKPFVKYLKVYFYMFDHGLYKEITDMKEVFTQTETKVANCSVERKTFAIKEKELLLENDHLLELLISQDLMHTAMNSLEEILDYKSMEKRFLDEYSELENRFISLEIKVQQYKESFQNNQPQNKQDAPEFLAFFEINELKARLQAKNNSINKLKDHIATLKGKGVSKCDKSENMSKVITPGIYKLDLEPLAPKLLRNREAHVDYLKHTQEHADTLREIVEHARALRPLDSDLDSACQTFTIVGNTCPLTRITSTTVVPPKTPLSTRVVNKTPPSSNNLGKLNDITNIGKSNKYTHKPKSDDSIQEKLYLLHMDLCGPMRIKSINGKKYILVIVDDYSRGLGSMGGLEVMEFDLLFRGYGVGDGYGDASRCWVRSLKGSWESGRGGTECFGRWVVLG